MRDRLSELARDIEQRAIEDVDVLRKRLEAYRQNRPPFEGGTIGEPSYEQRLQLSLCAAEDRVHRLAANVIGGRSYPEPVHPALVCVVKAAFECAGENGHQIRIAIPPGVTSIYLKAVPPKDPTVTEYEVEWFER